MAAIEIGQIEAIFRYPVKSMRGEALDVARAGTGSEAPAVTVTGRLAAGQAIVLRR